jgi:hypothetical protein
MATGNKSKTQDARRHRKDLAREERLKGRQEAQARRAQRDRMVYAGLAAVVVAIVAALAWAATRPQPPLPGVEYPNQGGEHIPRGQPHPAYNSNPPTSGWHNPESAPPGAYRDEVPDEIAVHNLEHGCIWVTYKDPKDADLVTKLEDLAAKYPATVLLSARSKNDSAVAVAAWRRLLKLEKFDEGQIVAFIKAFRNKGPEALNCVGGMPPR